MNRDVEVQVLIGPLVLGVRRRDRVQLRDAALVFGRRAYDRSEVRAASVAGSPRLLQLRLARGTSAKLLHLALPTAEACADLLLAISRWLADDGDDASAGSELEDNLRWEISRVEEEAKLWRALGETLIVLVRRVFRDLVPFGVFFIVCVCIGFGMVQAVAGELQARRGGEWIDGSCTLEGLRLTAERRLSKTAGPLWRVTGTYSVQVRFGDGCDDDAWRDALPARGAALDDVAFYASYDASDEEVDDDDLWLDRPAAVLGDLADDGARARDPTPARRPGAATCAADHDARLDPLRGRHVAYRTLVLDHDDFCYGPIGSNISLALRHCRNTQAVWLRHRGAIGASVPCHVLYKRLGGRAVAAHVVLHKAIPWEVRCFLGFWAVLACQLVWLLALCAQRLFRPQWFGPEEANADNVADILSLSGGVGQPNSQLSKRLEQMYAQGEAARGAVSDPRARVDRAESGGGVATVLPLL